jgi:hypothetical protein
VIILEGEDARLVHIQCSQTMGQVQVGGPRGLREKILSAKQKNIWERIGITRPSIGGVGSASLVLLILGVLEHDASGALAEVRQAH